MTSYAKPTDEQVDKALPLLSSPQHEAYFFDRLENPLWIAPLAKRDLFKHPPKAEPVKGGGVRFPPWPPSRYLARMAGQAPAEVAEIFANIETDNASVVGDMVKAALTMPTVDAAALVPAVSKAARKETLWVRFKDASDLCVQLAEGNEPDAALKLAEALYTPTFEQGQEEPSRREVYWYKRGLTNLVPVMARIKPREFLPNLCGWLNTSVEAKKWVDGESGDDHSSIWRPAIEEHEQNKDYDFAGVMVGFAREGFEVAIRNDGLSLDEALEIVERYPYLIFMRLRLHLIAEFAEQNTDLACQLIMNKGFFDDYRHKHEYAVLVGKRLNLLSPEQREQWFAWIDAGPDMSNFDESIQKNLGREPTGEDRKSRISYWQFEKLHLVRKHLQGDRETFYSQMLTEHGEPELADINVRVSMGFRGDESPMTVEDLTSKNFEEAVDAVSSWKPEDSMLTGPSIEGLGSTFEQYVATNPEKFSAEARLLIGRPANFVHRFVSRMTESVKAGRDINLAAVLDLCDWVLTRPVDERTTIRQMHDRLVDPDWQWTRDEIARFVRSVCKTDFTGGPETSFDEVRHRLWNLIEPLCQSSAKSYIAHDPSAEDPRIRDYLDLGINSSRGKAVEAGLAYARWVANYVKRTEGEREIVPDGFEAMPEVREMLEWQIASRNRSFEALSVIGSRIGLIFWIDRKWLAESSDRLFSLQDIEQRPAAAHGWAAWNAFLVWVRPHIEFYRLFKSQFSYAAEHAGKVKLQEQGRHQPMDRLGEHLMLLYGRGHLGLDDGDDRRMLRRFLEYANSEIRRHAIGFVGLALERDEEVPEVIITRFQTLWDVYWNEVGIKDATEAPNAWLFGTWFMCGKFPDQWALDRLYQFVEVNPTPEPDHSVAEKLAEIANVDIAKSVQILDIMVRRDPEGWRIDGWRDEARQILQMALGTTGEAYETAKQLIEYLGRRGNIEFGQLLP